MTAISKNSIALPGNVPGLSNIDKKLLTELREQVSPHDRATIKQAAEDFESLFLGIVLKSMRDTVQKSGLVDGGNAEDIYRGMLDSEYSKMMAEQRNTGLADHIEVFLLKAQAGVHDPNAIQTNAGLKAYKVQAAQEDQAADLPSLKAFGSKASRR